MLTRAFAAVLLPTTSRHRPDATPPTVEPAAAAAPGTTTGAAAATVAITAARTPRRRRRTFEGTISVGLSLWAARDASRVETEVHRAVVVAGGGVRAALGAQRRDAVELVADRRDAVEERDVAGRVGHHGVLRVGSYSRGEQPQEQAFFRGDHRDRAFGGLEHGPAGPGVVALELRVHEPARPGRGVVVRLAPDVGLHTAQPVLVDAVRPVPEPGEAAP